MISARSLGSPRSQLQSFGLLTRDELLKQRGFVERRVKLEYLGVI
jgi:hypothetical protein